jgi:hypothetical protein
MSWLHSNPKHDCRLDRMAQAAREIRGESLSGDARAAILEESLKPEQGAGYPALFTPTRHILVAGALPVILAFALLLGSNPGVQTPADAGDGITRVAVSKVNGQVQFEIENGSAAHTLQRTTDPRDLSSGHTVQVTDGYQERLNDQADLVFYRID